MGLPPNIKYADKEKIITVIWRWFRVYHIEIIYFRLEKRVIIQRSEDGYETEGKYLQNESVDICGLSAVVLKVIEK